MSVGSVATGVVEGMGDEYVYSGGEMSERNLWRLMRRMPIENVRAPDSKTGFRGNRKEWLFVAALDMAFEMGWSPTVCLQQINRQLPCEPVPRRMLPAMAASICRHQRFNGGTIKQQAAERVSRVWDVRQAKYPNTTIQQASWKAVSGAPGQEQGSGRINEVRGNGAAYQPKEGTVMVTMNTGNAGQQFKEAMFMDDTDRMEEICRKEKGVLEAHIAQVQEKLKIWEKREKMIPMLKDL